MSAAKESGLFVQREFAAGEHIITEGDVAETCFVVQSGRVELLARDDAGLYESVGTLGPGRVFGEYGLVGGCRHDKGARALEATQCVAIARAALDQRLEDADPFVGALVKVLTGNLNAILDRKRAAHRTDAGDGAAPESLDDLAQFAD